MLIEGLPGRYSQAARLLRALAKAGGAAQLLGSAGSPRRKMVIVAHPLRTRVTVLAVYRAVREGWIESRADGRTLRSVSWRLTEHGARVVEALEGEDG